MPAQARRYRILKLPCDELTGTAALNRVWHIRVHEKQTLDNGPLVINPRYKCVGNQITAGNAPSNHNYLDAYAPKQWKEPATECRLSA